MALSDNCEAYWDFQTSSLTDAINDHVLTATSNFVFEAASPGPCRHIDANGAAQGARCSTLTLTEPFTVACMMYPNGSASSAFYINYRRSGTNNVFAVWSSSNVITARSRAGGTAGDATAGTPTTTVFNNIAGVFTSTTSRDAYRDSTLGSNTTSVNPAGASTDLSIGAQWDGAFLNGAVSGWRFKYFAVWSRALSEAELDSYFTDPTQVLGGGSTFIPIIGRGPGMALVGHSGLVG